ncbi:hypothetical protein [Zongyangia hominis]|uniref:Uncharacterized protein n=1 Tax=Zongyangia hominis TaxID=2763677 RepID=A0A926E9T7_9FIRM|nr:hypothetical protein [Zongyangia hominis]MBC8570560.1 hypothetical protein [Zongyangia hominis]
MERHNVTVVDFGGKKKKKKPVGKIILFSLLGLVLLVLITVISIFALLPSLTDKEINKYVESQKGALTYADVIGRIPAESITFEEGTELTGALEGAAYRGVGLWDYNVLLRAGDKVMDLGELSSNTRSPTLDKPEVWQRMELVSYKGRVYLIKYFPSFYGPSNVSCYEILDGWDLIQKVDAIA